MSSNWRFSLRDLFSTLAVVAVALALTRDLLSLVSQTEPPYWAVCILFFECAITVYLWGDAIRGLLSRTTSRRWPKFASAVFASAILLLLFSMFLPA